MSEAPEDPLDVVYAALNPVEEGLDDPPDSGVNSVDVGEVFLPALADLGIRRATAEAADRLHQAGDRVTAAALWKEGRPVAWIPGAGGSPLSAEQRDSLALLLHGARAQT